MQRQDGKPLRQQSAALQQERKGASESFDSLRFSRSANSMQNTSVNTVHSQNIEVYSNEPQPTAAQNLSLRLTS